MIVLNVLNEKQLEEMTAFIAKLKWTDGKETARGSAKDIKENLQITEADPAAKPIFNDIRRLFKNDPTLSTYTVVKEIVGPRVAQYPEGGKYGWHVDMAIMNGQRTDLSFTLFLNDDYEGGELEMDLGTTKKIVKPKKGQMVLYPTGMLHQVNEVTKGKRLVIVGWVNSLIRDHEDRLALFKLQQEIQRLKAALANPEEVNQLNFLYQHFRRRLAD